ncbi:MAG: sensor histidine kinase [Pyrinomonadaceae bacterium]
MKGSLVTNLVLGGVLLVLTLFLGLQYNWLAQASEAERERLEKRAEADTQKLAEAFNREMQAAFFNFQADARGWVKGDWTEFNERFDYWRGRARYPDLIREVYFLGRVEQQTLRYDREGRAFVPAELAGGVAEFASGIRSEAWLKPFYEEPFAFVIPILDAIDQKHRILIEKTRIADPAALHMPMHYGLLVIMLDRDLVTGKMLPELFSEHFPDGDFRASVKNNSDAAVFETGGQLTAADASSRLMSLSPDSMVIFSATNAAGRMWTERPPEMMLSERIESRSFTRRTNGRDGTSSDTFTIQVDPGGTEAGPAKARASVITTTSPPEPWSLSIQHTSGSIAGHVADEFRKSFAIGLGIYLLLVGSIIAIVLSAVRARRFAQRQIDFVSSVSHEFRTPLAVIYSASENLADGVANDREQVARYGGLIKNEGRKLSAMVEQILEFAGARSGKRKYNFVLGDVTEAVRRALEEAEPALKESGFEVESSLTPDLPKTSIDPDAIETVVRNLIQNAVKYSNGSRWIRVATENGGDSIKIVVEDRGIGISDAERKKIFEPFYRGKEVVDAQIHGNGLGLSLVKEIIDVHGGKVGLTSEIGKGSRFVIEVPLS